MVHTRSCRVAVASGLSWLVLLVVQGAAIAGATGVELRYGPQRALPVLPSPTIGAVGVGADATGNVYAIDYDRVLELPAGATSLTAERVLPISGLNQPSGMTTDSAGDVYVADTGNGRVLELAAGASAPRVVPFAGLVHPSDVAVDSAGNLYVSDRDGPHPAVELPAGATSSASQVTLPFGDGMSPTGIAVDSQGDVYLANGGGDGDVQQLPAGASTPKTVPDVNGGAVAVAPDGTLYVGGGDGIQRFPALPNAQFPGAPLPLAGLSGVNGLAATARGLYMSDASHAVFFLTAGATNSAGQSILPFSGAFAGMPSRVVADGTGNVYELVDGRAVVMPDTATSADQARLAPVLATADAIAADGNGNLVAAVDEGNTLTGVEWSERGGPPVTRYTLGRSGIDFDGSQLTTNIGLDGRDDLFWGTTHQGPFLSDGIVWEQTPGSTGVGAVPFQNLRGVDAVAVSHQGDVYASSSGVVGVVRAGAPRSALVPLRSPVTLLAVDPWGGVYGSDAGGLEMLPAGACQADEVRIPVSSPAVSAISVDPKGDVFAADTRTDRVVILPAVGSVPVPACPLQLSRFTLRVQSRSLRFTLTSTDPRGIRRVAIQLPSTRLRFATRRRLRHLLKIRTNRGRHPAFRIRVHGSGLTITLNRPARRFALNAKHGAIILPDTRLFILAQGSTSIDVTGADGKTIPLTAPLVTP